MACYENPFFTRSGLTAAQLIALFLVKVMAGIFYGWVGVYYGDMARMVDTWYYHYQSLNESKLLLTNPAEYFASLFRNQHSSGYSGFLGGEGSWWNDLDFNFMMKLLGLFNVASFGHYYINVIFYSFLTLFGPIALYHVFNHCFTGKHAITLLAVFFIPSFIFWTSGLHKEGLIFNSIALIVYTYYFGLHTGRFSARRVACTFFSLLLLLLLRNYMVLMLLPALVAWIVSHRLNRKPVVIYGIIYLIFSALFFTAPHISSNLDFPGAVVEKQRQFSQLKGNSVVPVTQLRPTVSSFLANAPQAFTLAIMRPHFSDIRHLLSLVAAIEINSLLLLFVIYLIWNYRSFHQTPFSLFCLLFSAGVLLIMGYTVNFLGAIVRYRSVVLPLLFVPVIVKLPWHVLAQHVYNIKDRKM